MKRKARRSGSELSRGGGSGGGGGGRRVLAKRRRVLSRERILPSRRSARIKGRYTNDSSLSKEDPENSLVKPGCTTILLTATTEYVSYNPATKQQCWAVTSLKAPFYEPSDRASVDIVAVIDKSGSMRGQKIALVRETLLFVIDQLKETDRISLVVYDTNVELAFGLTKMTVQNRERAKRYVSSIVAGTCTNLYGGLIKGMEQVALTNGGEKAQVQSVLLLTDGLANQGITHTTHIVEQMKMMQNKGLGAVTKPSTSPPKPMFPILWGYPQVTSPQTTQQLQRQAPRQLQRQSAAPPSRQTTRQLQRQAAPSRPRQTTRQLQRQAAPPPSRQTTRQLQRQAAPTPSRQTTRQLQRQVAPSRSRQTTRQLQRQTAPPPSRQTTRQLQRQAAPPPSRQTTRQLQRQAAPPPSRQTTRQLQRQAAPPFPQQPPVQQSLAPLCPPQAVFGTLQASPSFTPSSSRPKSAEEMATDGYKFDGTVYTFGFGSDHDADMLEAISTQGGGVYYYIDTNEKIPESFADCLGGLLSVTGQNVSVKLQAQGDTSFKKVHTSKDINWTKPNNSCEVAMGDIQSEEGRDLVLELELPPVPASEHVPLVSVELSYFNVITSQFDTVQCQLTTNRTDGERGSGNITVDKQRNRVLAAGALKKAEDLGDKNKLKEAQSILRDAVATLKSSISKDEGLVKLLLLDLNKCLETMKTRESFKSHGKNYMCSKRQTHSVQRSNFVYGKEGKKLEAFGYGNVSKAAYRLKAKSKK